MKTKAIRFTVAVFERDGSFRYVYDDVTNGYFVFDNLKEAKEFLVEIKKNDEPKAVILKETRELIQ